jgi:hypothetical protein
MNSAKSVTANFRLPGAACDINNDGKMNVADVQALINEARGATLAAHDLNADRAVNVVDVQREINARTR